MWANTEACGASKLVTEQICKERDKTESLKMFINLKVGRKRRGKGTKEKGTNKKFSKDADALNGTIDRVNLTDIYRSFRPTIVKYTLFANVRGTSPRQTVSRAIKQVSKNLKEFKSYKKYSD